MIVLGIETSTAVCAAAIVEHGKVCAERSVEAQYIHSERLIGLVEECIRSVPHAPSLPDAIAVSIGPGSFTGLRIGLSVAKGFAYAGGKILVPVPTLEALAFQAFRSGGLEPGSILMPMIDARRDEVFTALYRVAGEGLEELSPAGASTLAECESAAGINGNAASIIVTGDGAEKFRQHLHRSGHTGLYRFAAGEAARCSASSVALLGERMAAAGHVADTASLEPVYVKEFQTSMKIQHPEGLS
jgi:tRNA threonylcarbamoyladenosine biosynthesis protein TsaB